MKNQFLKIFGACIIFWFGLDLLLGIYQVRTFTFVDDHTLVSYFDELQQKKFWSLFNEILIQNDRFRPLLNIHKIIFLSIFGLNIHLWEFYFLILGAATSTVFILYFQKINFSIKESILASILLLFGMQGVIWWVFDSSENLGMLLLGIGLLCLEKSKNSPNNVVFRGIAYVSIFLMSLSKESFVFVLPLLSYLYRNNKSFSIFSIFLFLVELVIIKFYIQTTFGGYAGVDEATFGIKNIVKVFVQYLLRAYGFSLIFLVFLWFKENKFKLKNTQLLYQSAIIFILGVCPFLLIYTKSGINVGRYVLPLLLGQILILHQFYHQLKTKRFQQITWLVTIALLAYHSIKFVEIQTHFRKENITCQEFFDKIEQNIPKSAKITIIAHPQEDLEAGEALKKYLISPYFLDKPNTQLLYLNPQDQRFEEQLKDEHHKKYIILLNETYSVKNKQSISLGKYRIIPL